MYVPQSRRVQNYELVQNLEAKFIKGTSSVTSTPDVKQNTRLNTRGGRGRSGLQKTGAAKSYAMNLLNSAPNRQLAFAVSLRIRFIHKAFTRVIIPELHSNCE